MALDPRIEAVREQYGLSSDDFWQIPQNKQWVCKHAALEIVATKANVEWAAPQIIQADTANGIAVLSVSGKMGDRVEWSTGEASPKNNKNSYPWAMAEKRAKDRVVLKLAGIHGLVYSEDEMPNAEEPRTADRRSEQGRRETAKSQTQTEANPAVENLWAELIALSSARGLEGFWKENVKAILRFDEANRKRFIDKKDALKAKFAPDVVDTTRDEFPGSRVVDDRAVRDHPLMAG